MFFTGSQNILSWSCTHCFKKQFQSLAEIKPNELILMVTMTCPPKMHRPTDLLMHELVYQVYKVVLAAAVVPGMYQA